MAAPHTGKHPGHHTPGFTKHTSARGAPHPGLHEKNPSPTCGFHSEARTGTYPHPPCSPVQFGDASKAATVAPIKNAA